MTVIKGGGGIGSHQQNHNRPSATAAATVINPYVKTKMQGTATVPRSGTSHVRLSAPSKGSPKSSSSPNASSGLSRVSYAVTPINTQRSHSNEQASTHDGAKASSTPISSAISPKFTNPRGNPNLTPTPKKLITSCKLLEAAHILKSDTSRASISIKCKTDNNDVAGVSSNNGGRGVKAVPSTSGSIPIQSNNPNTITNHNPAMKPNGTKSKPTSLKSQLKSQIAALQRQKKQHLQQIERELQLARKEEERKQKEAEMARLQLLKEKEREYQKRLREERRKEEERLKLEKRMEREREKEEKATRREVGGCLSHLIRRVEGRIQWEEKRGVKYAIGEVVECLILEVEKRNPHSAVNGCGSGYVGKQNSIFSSSMTFQPMWSPCHGFVRNNFASLSQYAIQSLPFSTQSMLPPSRPVIMPQEQRPKQPKPLILHENPMDRYSPFRESHHVFESTVRITKKSVHDSFGVTLRWECRSVLVPRESDVVEDKNGVDDQIKYTALSENLAAPTCREAHTPPSSGVLAVGLPLVEESKPSVDLEALVQPPSKTNDDLSSNPKQRKKRRRRVNIGVMIVTDVSKAKPVYESEELDPSALRPSDIILAVNGRTVGGLSFSEACRAIATTSVEDEKMGFISCYLKVARMIQVEHGHPSQCDSLDKSSLGTNNTVVKTTTPAATTLSMSKNTNVASSNTVYSAQIPVSAVAPISKIPSAPLIPFIFDGGKISGEFTLFEWQTLVRCLSDVHRELSTGMALQPVSLSDILVACLKKEEYQKVFHQRSIDTLESKLSHEGMMIESEMKRLAEEHWASQWKSEVDKDASNENNALFQEPLTDSKRSALRSLARPSNGCRCGSMTHDFVNDPKCVLYRDVKSFIATGDDDNNEPLGAATRLSKHHKARNALEAAYIDRFVKLRAETQAAKQEAEFVLNMEIKQSSKMKKAVLCPSSLCTIVLSAIASLAEDNVNDKKLLHSLTSSANGIGNSNHQCENNANGCEDGSDEEEDIPLNLLAPTGSKRDTSANARSPKRIKLSMTDIGTEMKKESPSPYFLAKILMYISKTYGHLFHEPSHVEYAWQQRHRCIVTSPLPKEVMYKGNPRKPGNLSFENIQYMLFEERMARLQNAASSQGGLYDEWIVTYLSSNEVTGLRHEIDVLESMGLVEISKGGKVSLTSTWQSKVPHIMLMEMRDDWGPEKDVHNLHCVHTMIRELGKNWECVGEDGWRFSLAMAASEDKDLDFENEEYYLRKQIFYENFESFVNEEIGVGDFGC